jgi:hypothetical protein
MKYFLNNEPKGAQPREAYRLENLRAMNIFQLQDLCRRENIINASIDRLDREELIQLILTYRGTREHLLISGFKPDRLAYLEKELAKVKILYLPHEKLRLPSKIAPFDGLETGYFDDYSLSYLDELDGVNAFVLDKDRKICAVLHAVKFPGAADKLYLTSQEDFPYKEGTVNDHYLMLCPHKFSDTLTAAYNGDAESLPIEAQAYYVPLLAFEVCGAREAQMPLAIDFGTSNTSAGVHISQAYFADTEHHVKPGLLQRDSVNYVQFLSPEGEILPLLPTVIGVDRIEGNQVKWSYGFSADGLMSQGYMGKGVCVFYDIKRWASNFDESEILTDSEGRQLAMPRKKIIRAYFDYIIKSAERRFKCRFKKLFVSYPVKQRDRFISLYREIFAEYDLMESEMFDEGIAVLYNIIDEYIKSKNYPENTDVHTLILDCGGGTTDQTSAAFRIRTGQSAYEIDITSAYENGDTDFGGNNLTYRVMQLMKVEAAHLISSSGKSLAEITADLPDDQYRTVDNIGRDAIYKELDEAYKLAEAIIPTRYRDYEYSGREEYYKVYNNFHYLFSLAERVKKAFFTSDQILRIVVSSENINPQPDTTHIRAQRWKLAARSQGALNVKKDMPTVGVNTYQVRAIFQADIYDIFRRLSGRLYQEKQLSSYSIVKMTGQSCKISLFRDSLKEYVPGTLIRQGSATFDKYQLKLACLEGAISYLRDKSLGLAKVNIHYERPSVPYILTAYAHNGDRITLIHSLDPGRVSGTVSRYISASEVEVTLSDTAGSEKYRYVISSQPDGFRRVTYEDIESIYGRLIPQDEVDAIENGEIRYFVWAEAAQWGFSIVPISRRDEELHLGPQQVRLFEDESWMVNFFDGLH